MKFAFTFIFVFLLVNISNAQVENDTIYLPRHIIKFSPISLVDLNTPSFQFSYERALENDAAIQFELGYINNIMYRAYSLPLQGYRARVELRRYHYGHTESKVKNYIGVMMMLKQSFEEKNDYFDRFNGLYQERISYQEVRTGAAVYFTMGKQIFFNESISCEFGFAAGLRYFFLQKDVMNIPSDAQLENRSILNLESGSYLFPSIFPVLKFAYCIQ